MARKTQRSKKSGSGRARQISQKETLLLQLQLSSFHHDWPEMVVIARKLLNNFALEPELRVAVLGSLGTAYAGSGDYEQAYEALTDALAINPDDPDVLYARGNVAWRINRSGQYAQDVERAAALIGSDSTHDLVHEVQVELKKSRKLLKGALEKRGSHFTLEQLIEQEELYAQSFKRTRVHDWAGAELLLRRVIGMAEKDYDPRPWNNLGLCLVQQQRFDEAEAAWKRALKIDRFYRLARNNLLLLPDMRRGEEIVVGRYVEDFAAGKGKLKLIIPDEL